MTAHVKTYTLTIETDDATKCVVSAPSARAVAAMALRQAPHVRRAICIEGDDLTLEAVAEKLLDIYGADFDMQGNPYFEDPLAAFPEDLAESLRALVNESDALREWADLEMDHGYSLEQHHADERAMLEVL